MASSPPPYEELPPPSFEESDPSPFEQQIQSILSTFVISDPDGRWMLYRLAKEMAISSHPHEALFSFTSRKDQPVLIGMHYWSPGKLHSSRLFPLSIDSENLRCFEGFRGLGSFRLPDDCADSLDSVHDYLSSLIPGYRDDRLAPSSESEITASITTGLIERTQSFSQAVRTQLFSIPVQGNSEEDLFGGGSIPIWKWVWPKHDSYRRCGFWEVNVDVSLSVRWRGYEEMYLLVRGIPEEKRGHFTEAGVHVRHTNYV